MWAALLASLEGSSLAAALRGSVWLYPLVNAGHIVGVALLFGAIVPLDLRLVGAWRSVPLQLLSRVLVPLAGAGLALAVCNGFLLFIVKAGAYAASGLFQAKMLILGVGAANALVYLVARPRADGATQRFLGATSLLAWPCVIVLGRLVGYF